MKNKMIQIATERRQGPTKECIKQLRKWNEQLKIREKQLKECKKQLKQFQVNGMESTRNRCNAKATKEM
jgi:uncharacterized protein (DUF342 family)